MADEEQHTGVGVFLIPEASDPIVAASSEPAHLTTVWLGDMGDLDEATIDALRTEVADYAASLDGPVVVPVTERGTLGDEDADVAFLEPTEALLALREGLLEASPTVRRVMESVEQFPQWTPHVTLGYPETPAAGEYDGEAVTFDRVGLWVGPDQEEYPMSGKKDESLAAGGIITGERALPAGDGPGSPDYVVSKSALERVGMTAERFNALTALAAARKGGAIRAAGGSTELVDLDEPEDEVEDDEMPMDELEDGEELITEIPVHGVATVEGVPTGDGRGFRPGAIKFGPLPQPLGYEFESGHGSNNSRVAIIGRIDEYERRELEDGTAEIRWRGVIMPDKPYGSRAIESIVDGSYTGLSVIVDSVTVDVEEEREAMRQRLSAPAETLSEGETLSADEIEAMLDDFIGDGTQPVTWFSDAQVRRFDMVPTGAFQQGYTALGHEFAEELTEEQLTAAAQALEDCGCADEITAEEVASLAQGQYVVEFSGEEGTSLYGPFATREEADAWIGSAGDGEYQPISISPAFREISSEDRKRLADEGKALPDGSFPIETVEDLRNAIQSIGRASDPEAAKAHIKKRARELDQEDLVPEDWAAHIAALTAAAFAPGTKDGPGWITHPVPTARIRRYWVRGKGAAKIRWGAPGDFNRCRAQLAKYVQNPEWLAGLCANMHKEAIGVWPGQEGGGRDRHSLVASGTPAPLVVMASATTEHQAYPAELFTEPTEDHTFGLRVDRETRRVWGYAASWDSCHIGISGMCQKAPRSRSDYAFFRKGVVDTTAGEQRVGLITSGIGHADEYLGAAAATAHYDQTDAVRAYINIGENSKGIWFSGVLAPGVTDAQIDEMRAIGRTSGDWRNWSGMRGDLELVGLVVVNTEGYQLAASAGVQTTAIGLGSLPAEEPEVVTASASESPLEGAVDVLEFDMDELADRVASRIVYKQERAELAAKAAPARAALRAHQLRAARAQLAHITKE